MTTLDTGVEGIFICDKATTMIMEIIFDVILWFYLVSVEGAEAEILSETQQYK